MLAAVVRDLPTNLDGYRLLAHVARGGTSSVYLAESSFGDRVAIKVLDPMYASDEAVSAAFLAEADVTNLTTHRNLLSIHRSGRTATGAPYLVMELLDGETLQALVDRADVPLVTVLAIAREIALGVTALHAVGITHCDIKPSNVLMMVEDGGYSLKVIDYGIAHRTTDGTRDTIAGTPSCMAPEQWRGSPSSKSDVYALGCMMFELITHEPLFSGTIPQLAIAHCEQMPVRPSSYLPGIDPALERLIVRMLAKDPAMRPTMVDAAVELDRLARQPVRSQQVDHLALEALA